LSSGEQEEIILLYELLFIAPDESLILLDEPETSLHVSWQQMIIEDLHKIAELKQHNYIISTHSPDIIGGNLNLTKDLFVLHNQGL
jgi:ABC-type glutathione transport system ATPase component